MHNGNRYVFKNISICLYIIYYNPHKKNKKHINGLLKHEMVEFRKAKCHGKNTFPTGECIEYPAFCCEESVGHPDDECWGILVMLSYYVYYKY